MIPNFIWFAIPTENDVLRAASLTPVIDMVATIFQVIMIASLCLIKNIEYQKSENKKRLFEIIISVVIYYFGWCMYYSQIVNTAVILILCIAPCIAFIIYSIEKKNLVALISAIVFMMFHTIYGLVNFPAT
ncbi:MAG: hypothetical protein PHR53_03825 [Bacteroidales bacterium]|nr:hypothetical protein [Bacteroidales bacterium]